MNRAGSPADIMRQDGCASHANRSCHVVRAWLTLNLVVQFSQSRFDLSFAALSDPTRRSVLERLGQADASITELAQSFDMTLTGMKKHVGILEKAGLVTTRKIGRVRTCSLGASTLDEEMRWIERYRRHWAARFEELDKVVRDLKGMEQGSDGRK